MKIMCCFNVHKWIWYFSGGWEIRECTRCSKKQYLTTSLLWKNSVGGKYEN